MASLYEMDYVEMLLYRVLVERCRFTREDAVEFVKALRVARERRDEKAGRAIKRMLSLIEKYRRGVGKHVADVAAASFGF